MFTYFKFIIMIDIDTFKHFSTTLEYSDLLWDIVSLQLKREKCKIEKN